MTLSEKSTLSSYKPLHFLAPEGVFIEYQPIPVKTKQEMSLNCSQHPTASQIEACLPYVLISTHSSRIMFFHM